MLFSYIYMEKWIIETVLVTKHFGRLRSFCLEAFWSNLINYILGPPSSMCFIYKILGLLYLISWYASFFEQGKAVNSFSSGLDNSALVFGKQVTSSCDEPNARYVMLSHGAVLQMFFNIYQISISKGVE